MEFIPKPLSSIDPDNVFKLDNNHKILKKNHSIDFSEVEQEIDLIDIIKTNASKDNAFNIITIIIAVILVLTIFIFLVFYIFQFSSQNSNI